MTFHASASTYVHGVRTAEAAADRETDLLEQVLTGSAGRPHHASHYDGKLPISSRHIAFPSTTLLAPRQSSGERNLTFVVPCITSDAMLQSRAAMLPLHHRGELQELDPDCFPPFSEYTAARCCDTQKGLAGDTSCWADGFDYKRCCPHGHVTPAPSGAPK